MKSTFRKSEDIEGVVALGEYPFSESGNY